MVFWRNMILNFDSKEVLKDVTTTGKSTRISILLKARESHPKTRIKRVKASFI